MSTLPAPEAPQPADTDSGKQPYNRFAISMPAAMADDIRALCHRESRSHSEFFREAVRTYLQQRHLTPSPPLHSVSAHSAAAAAHRQEPPHATVRELRPAVVRDDAFADFTEWAEDKEYNQLSGLTSGKD
jgi:Arc/MetJ-type ribon-helix-helix transcriptional regulator